MSQTSDLEERYESHDKFLEMLNREFPRGVQVESSRLQVPAGAAGSGRVRNVSPSNNLPRQCGISESESKSFPPFYNIFCLQKSRRSS